MPAPLTERRPGSEIPLFKTEKPPSQRYVITGMGTINPAGRDVPSTIANFRTGGAFLSPTEKVLPEEDLKFTNIKVVGHVKGWDPIAELQHMGVTEKDLKQYSRVVQFALKATDEALADAGLLGEDRQLLPHIDRTLVGVRMGTGIGGAAHIARVFENLKKGGRRNINDVFLALIERVSTAVSMHYGAQAILETNSNACATGVMSLIGGVKDVMAGDADIMIVGAGDATVNLESLTIFETLRYALSKSSDVNAASLPGDKRRGGFVFSEGFGVYVIETLEHARKRGARIYAELLGWGATADAFHETAPNPDGEGLARAMQRATRNINPEVLGTAVVEVNAHGTGTVAGDPPEVKAVKSQFPEGNWGNVVYDAHKSRIGHTLGGAGTVELVSSVVALQDGVVSGTANLLQPMDELAGLCVPTQPTKKDPVVIIKNGSGFGGPNGSVALARPSDIR